MRETVRANKGFFLTLLAFEVLLALLLPLVLLLDSAHGSRRDLYDDIERMAVAQHETALREGRPEAVDISAGEQGDVGGRSFTPHEGDSVSVDLQGDGYCISATDADGDTGTRCWRTPADPAQDEGYAPGA